MATGKSAENIYHLIEELNCGGIDYGSSVVLADLIRYLNTDTLEDFISYFRRNHDMIETELEDDDTETFDPDYHICMDCQDTYDVNKVHICESTQPEAKYFTSLIPEC
jgi:hypothetical protein